MPRYIALLRGINVGGKNSLPMADLRAQMEGSGFDNVHTYIQSGNIVFDSKRKSVSSIGKFIRDRLHAECSIAVPVLVLKQSEFETAIEKSPFKKEVSDAKSVHFFFLDSKPTLDDPEKITDIQAASERWKLVDKVFYLHAPDGIGRSKLATRVEKLLGVVATARNYRTVAELKAMLDDQ
tara:strand:+ start:204 stop:743 length:540 start_codon:yes stop_codon:yes gene_type:complete